MCSTSPFPSVQHPYPPPTPPHTPRERPQGCERQPQPLCSQCTYKARGSRSLDCCHARASFRQGRGSRLDCLVLPVADEVPAVALGVQMRHALCTAGGAAATRRVSTCEGHAKIIRPPAASGRTVAALLGVGRWRGIIRINYKSFIKLRKIEQPSNNERGAPRWPTKVPAGVP